jgi:hypothetical protein
VDSLPVDQEQILWGLQEVTNITAQGHE